MPRVPRDTGSASLIWNDGRWGADLTVRAEGPDADEDPSTFSPAIRPGFVTVNLAGSYALTHSIDLTARIEDIANARYEEVLGYGEPGQMLFIGFRAKN
jgi:vitamin B12 transporter